MTDQGQLSENQEFDVEVKYGDTEGHSLSVTMYTAKLHDPDNNPRPEQEAILGREDFVAREISLKCPGDEPKEVTIPTANAIAFALDRLLRASNGLKPGEDEIGATLETSVGGGSLGETVQFVLPNTINPLKDNCEKTGPMM